MLGARPRARGGGSLGTCGHRHAPCGVPGHIVDRVAVHRVPAHLADFLQVRHEREEADGAPNWPSIAVVRISAGFPTSERRRCIYCGQRHSCTSTRGAARDSGLLDWKDHYRRWVRDLAHHRDDECVCHCRTWTRGGCVNARRSVA